MAKIILATGGARSGKSAYVQNLAESLLGNKVFIATCPTPRGEDAEMLARVERHRQDRLGAGWLTVEEGLDLEGVLAGNPDVQVMLVDCLTLWISNLMQALPVLDEDEMAVRCRKLVATCRKRAGTVIFVSNEVGCGIVPDNAIARKFRDLSGRCNQVMAKEADEVIFFSCGLPLFLKQSEVS
jgi:adenosylcobinamide kinase/adenosylcobinamide-phosphate guanylyltransferase